MGTASLWSRFVPPPRDGPDDLPVGPIQGELLGQEHLLRRAHAIARGQTLASRPHPGRRPRLLARLNATHQILTAAQARLSAVGPGTDVSPAGEWLLDNFHVVAEHMAEVRASLPRDYYRELPELASGPLAGYPRVYDLAITLISHTEGRLDLDNIEGFVAAFQREVSLGIGELWAIPAMLRLGLIESVRRMTLRTVHHLDEIQAGDRWADRIRAAEVAGPVPLRSALGAFMASPPPLTAGFVSHLLQQLRQAGGEPQPLARLEAWMADHGPSAEEADVRAAQRRALTQRMMANSITSLRVVGRLDWREFVERQSAMEAVLRDDPSRCYARMTFATRDRYRHVVERVARRTGRREEDVALQALTLARAAAGGMAPWRAHIGYFLVDDGLAELATVTGYRRRPGEAVVHAAREHPDLFLGGGILTGTILALAILVGVAGPAVWSGVGLVVLVALLPALDIAVHAVHQLVTALLPPGVLPKLDLRTHGVPEGLRTVVVIPTLFDTVASVHRALENLEVQYLANRGAHVHFAVLSDFTDAATATLAGDAAILAAATTGLAALNAEHAPATHDAFHLFHRPRRWNPSEGTWMGWERKRGKLREFNQCLRSGTTEAFQLVLGRLATLRSVRYVITLDADTMLPAEAAPLLIGTMAHPLNRAVFDPACGRVVRGYGVLQPRVSVSLPSALQTPFAAVHSGHPGVDPYSSAVSDVYQDLYGEGSYTGKGIYELDVFETATAGRFPENTLLSHDLIEGSYVRAGLVTDITMYDDHPARYLSHTRRKHRWIRGDWQLVGWLGRWVPGPAGSERNRLPLIARWKVVDNLRRSMMEIAWVGFFVAGWLVLPGSPLRWTALALLGVAAPWLFAVGLAAVRPPRDASWRAYYAAIARDLVTSARQVGLAVAFLPHQAWISADAILRTWFRMWISGRRLLEWQAAAQSEQRAAERVGATWRQMAPAVGMTGAFALLVLLPAGQGATAWPRLVAAVPILLLWGAAPAIARLVSAPVSRRRDLSAAMRVQARDYARRHWAFFERFVTADTHWLVPDNFQEEPDPVVAMRTSPTNIGLQLLATVSAADLGFITPHQMVERLEAAFASLDRLDRYRGHFFNWYDLHDLRILAPAYVSTVDSGNLAGHLIALRQACLAMAASESLRQRLLALAARAQAMAQAMEFGFLYDPTRELLAIGYDRDRRTLDGASYDLLASEARLASFMAIAKHDVPVAHWFRLGRTLTQADGATALVSWSGSMFEYLMPGLIMRTYPSTLLDQTGQAAIARQMRHGAAHGTPWGISESAYNVRDRHQTYQYRAFGVPDLALQRGLGRDLVVAPYASLLALEVTPRRAMGNLEALVALGALGPYGFRDAVDFTRTAPDGRAAIVATYMAHHIGMGLVALTNVLTAGTWQERFHAEAMVRAAELLLHERIPRRTVLQAPQPDAMRTVRPAELPPRAVVREVLDPAGAPPRIAMLGRAPYTVMVSSAGGGPSQFDDLAVTRWRPDATADATGQFCYLRDLTTGHTWSAAHQPTCVPAAWSRVVLAIDRVTFHRLDGEIATQTEIAVVPEDAAEVRRVTVTNTGATAHDLELTSYGEVVLARQAADRAHPAFSNLFVETEWHDWCAAITATRRPRSTTDRALWCVHVVDAGPDGDHGVSCETDRARFLGRGRSVRAPIAMRQEGPLSGTTGAVLDPIIALRVRLHLEPGATASVAFTTLVATSRERALEMAGRYHDPHTAQRAFDLAAMSAQTELRDLEVTAADAAMFQDLAGHLLRGAATVRAPQEELRQHRGAQSRLWAHGLSGDHPIVLASIADADGLATVRQLLAAHRYWRLRGMTVDLVVMSTRPAGYMLALDTALTAAVYASGQTAVLDQSGGVFLRRHDQLGTEDVLMFRAMARLVIPCDGRSLAAWVDGLAAVPQAATVPVQERRRLARTAAGRRTTPPDQPRRWWQVRSAPDHHVLPDAAPPPLMADPVPPPGGVLMFDNGIGGMNASGDYAIRVRGDHLPPAPWVNVIANPHGGCIISDRGIGTSWSGNSHFFRVTPWHNDPVTDPVGEVLYLGEASTDDLWSATPAPMDSRDVHHVVHGPGRSTFTVEHAGIRSVLRTGMVTDHPLKVTTLRLTNTTDHDRQITVTAYAEWTLGVLREQARHHVGTTYDAIQEVMLARNRFEPAFADRLAFHALSAPVTAHTADRTAFLGLQGHLGQPAALRPGAPPWVATTGVGHDPCSALQCEVHLPAGATRDVAMLLGTAADEEAVTALVRRYRAPERAAAGLGDAVAAWEERLATVTVRTPEPSFDLMLNRWTLYQALSCRMWGRAAVYQSGGAYGFRDQLQDVMAFVHAEPGLAREHILRATARQFVEGDVQHWWHPEGGQGTRTRFSDDLVWLPHVVDHYVRSTGDTELLDAMVPFLVMRTLAPEEQEVYDRPQVSPEVASVHEHCLRALRTACTSGVHGLPLIGGGDWNDGMNHVGIGGRGESVWLAWFLVATLRAYAGHAAARGEAATVAELTGRADAYVRAIEASGWDGAWYRRAFYDDGTPLGSAANAECAIDAIAQSWSVLSGAGQPDRQREAMRSLEHHLILPDARVVRLLTPPFEHTARDPGYIKGYLPGVRENGAQYTHAALWAVLAAVGLGDGDRAFTWFQMLNPLTHGGTPDGMRTYKVEPYVVAADVYTASGHVGRGGWTWYTGAASWMYRAGLEGILGFTKRGDRLTITPQVPATWTGFDIDYRYGASRYHIRVQLPPGGHRGPWRTCLDGVPCPDGEIVLVDDGGSHQVEVHGVPEPAQR